jgi:hypothetical protein
VSAIGLRRLWPILAVLLAATGFRFAALPEAPPGWRDDELIEFDMAARIRDGWRPLYIAEAEGHEPLFHYLQAATIALFGENVVGYKWLSMAFGVSTLALTYALARRLLGAQAAFVAAALMAVSFWPIMYARLGLRHIGLLPWMLGVCLVACLRFPRLRAGPTESANQAVVTTVVVRPATEVATMPRQILFTVVGGLCLAAGLMTYFAGRVVPVVVVVFALYLALLHRAAFRRAWPGVLAVLAIGLALAASMFVEINRLLPEGEQRLSVVGPQLDELRTGNLQPALETTLGTLGMFTFRGDPEALYNVEGRPVFDWLTGAFFYAGLAIALWRWKRVEYGFTLIAFGLGLAPAFISNPPGSFSHTIAAMPFVYVLAALGIVVVTTWLGEKMTGRPGSRIDLRVSPVHLVALFVVVLNTILTVRDYFGAWAHDDYVRFLYHAPIRDIAGWLDERDDVTDVSIGTHPNYLWLDPLALRLDLIRDDVRARWFDPETALVLPPGGLLIVTPLRPVDMEADANNAFWAHCSLARFARADMPGVSAFRVTCPEIEADLKAVFDGSLGLEVMVRDLFETARPGESLARPTVWRLLQPADDARLKLFVHVLDADGRLVTAGDRQDANMASLQPGDRLIQLVRLAAPADLKPGSYPVVIGWYHPDTGARLRTAGGADAHSADPLVVQP